MSEPFVSTSVNVSLDFFKKAVLSKKLKNLLIMYDEEIHNKFDEIVVYLEEKYPLTVFDYDEFKELFKREFCIKVLNIAIEKAVNENESYNLIKNTLEVLTDETIEKAINGPVIIDSFASILLSYQKLYDLRDRFSDIYYN